VPAASQSPAHQPDPVVGVAGPTTKVKICGLTNLADAEMAVELGAWALGMIFYEASPRSCSAQEAVGIVAALRRRVEVCGVFVNESLERIAELSDEVGLSMIQLHGDEGPAFCSEVARKTGARVIKAVQVSVPGDVRDVERFHVDFHLLDARSRAKARSGMRGGTGETFDWALVASRRSKVPLILSGGIDGQNAEAAIEAVHPLALDSASGTESSPGHKDPVKMAALFEAVRRAHAPAEPQEAQSAQVVQSSQVVPSA
jgi:phosphoribosylanthranilate isomerase